MTRISVVGGSGYAGAFVVREAVARSHQVTSISRHRPAAPVPGVEYVEADVLSDGTLERMVRGADVVVSALAPRGALAGRTRSTLADLAAVAGQGGCRLGVVGGAGTLRIGKDGPLVKDAEDFPAEFRAEAEEMAAVLDDLRATDTQLDWFYVSPAGGFGPWSPGTATGTYRTGEDELLVDAAGRSEISGADLANAVLNEIETPTRRGRRFTVAY